jgi:hypothetical protein
MRLQTAQHPTKGGARYVGSGAARGVAARLGGRPTAVPDPFRAARVCTPGVRDVHAMCTVDCGGGPA